MSSKKIILKTSVNKINQKVNSKKRKQSKLKLILADPHKYQIKTLSPQNAEELCEFIHWEIKVSGCPGRVFAKRFGISLGMASCLRAISNRSTACVLLSSSIKPKFILQQIAYFTRQRNAEAKVFMVTNLEELSNKMFGFNSNVMTFAYGTSPKIADWIGRQSLIKDQKLHVAANPCGIVRDAAKSSPFNKFDVNSILLRKDERHRRAFVPSRVINCNQQTVDNRIKQTADYLAFNAHTSHPAENIRVSDAELREGRINMMRKFSKISNRTESTKASSTDKSEKEKPKAKASSSKLPKIVYEEYDEDFDFPYSYGRYKTLTILPNRQRIRMKEKS